MDQVGAPMKGEVVVVKVVPGETVEAGQVVAVISAMKVREHAWPCRFYKIYFMKMEMAVQTSVSGVVRATHVSVGDKIDAEDLLIEIEE